MKKPHKQILIFIITICIASIPHLIDHYKQKILLQKDIKQKQSIIQPLEISADIENDINKQRPSTAISYILDLSKIKFVIKKDFYKFQDEEISQSASNIQALGWVDDNKQMLGFNISFHNSEFLLENPKQIDEIKNTLETGDIRVRFLLQDYNSFLSSGDNFDQKLPLVVTINNVSRGEVANINFIKNGNNFEIKGSMEIKPSDYNINLPIKKDYYEYEDKLKITFEGEMRPLQ